MTLRVALIAGGIHPMLHTMLHPKPAARPYKPECPSPPTTT